MIGSLRELLPPSQLTQDTVQRALLVGWCIELVRTCYDVLWDKSGNIPHVFLLSTNLIKRPKPVMPVQPKPDVACSSVPYCRSALLSKMNLKKNTSMSYYSLF